MRNKPKFSARLGAAALVSSLGVLGLASGSAQAADDSGPRKDAEGQYDVSTNTYTVVAGDALSEIAERLGTTVDELKRLNTLTSDEIKVGQKLVVATGLEGTVMAGGQAVSGATMTLWRTAGKESPESLAEVTTGENGGFKVRDFLARADGNVFYLTARGGAGDALALMSVLGSDLPDSVVVNELTTVASVFTHARFIDGTAISGNPLGLHIAAGNVPNLWTLAPAPGAR